MGKKEQLRQLRQECDQLRAVLARRDREETERANAFQEELTAQRAALAHLTGDATLVPFPDPE